MPLELDPELYYLWGWFCKIQNAAGEFSPLNVKAYFDLIGVQPLPFEIDCLMRLSAAITEE